MKQKTIKPRNHVVLALLKSARNPGAHVKSEKAQRRKAAVETAKMY